jgi:hypothetical protein
MAHTKVIERKERIMDQLGKGYRTRYTPQVTVLVANDRGSDVAPGNVVADVIRNETLYKGIFVAPCKCTVLRCFSRAYGYPNGGTITARFYNNANAITAAESIDALTGKLTADLTITGNADLDEGALVYVVVAVSNDAVATRSNSLVLGVEYMPAEA